ncbi:hypothetical protein ACFLZX_02955 [Nanoarchaeota archaeon]
MNRVLAKKVFWIGLVLVLLMPFTYAANGTPGTGGIFETIHNTLGWIPDKLTGDWQDEGFFLARFMIFLLVFSILFYLSAPIFKESKGVRIAVPMIISIMSVVLIPKEVLQNIFQTYSLFVMIALWIIPIAGAVFINYKLKDTLGDNRAYHLVALLLYAFVVWAIFQMDSSMFESIGYAEAFGTVPVITYEIRNYLSLVSAVVYFLILYHMFHLISGGAESGFKMTGEGSATRWASFKNILGSGPRIDRGVGLSWNKKHMEERKIKNREKADFLHQKKLDKIRREKEKIQAEAAKTAAEGESLHDKKQKEIELAKLEQEEKDLEKESEATGDTEEAKQETEETRAIDEERRRAHEDTEEAERVGEETKEEAKDVEEEIKSIIETVRTTEEALKILTQMKPIIVNIGQTMNEYDSNRDEHLKVYIEERLKEVETTDTNAILSYYKRVKVHLAVVNEMKTKIAAVQASISGRIARFRNRKILAINDKIDKLQKETMKESGRINKAITDANNHFLSIISQLHNLHNNWDTTKDDLARPTYPACYPNLNTLVDSLDELINMFNWLIKFEKELYRQEKWIVEIVLEQEREIYK